MSIEFLNSTVLAGNDGTATPYSNVVLDCMVSGNRIYTLHSVSITGTTRYGRIFAWTADPSLGLVPVASSAVFAGVAANDDFRHLSLLSSASAVVMSSVGTGATYLNAGWNVIELSSLYVTKGNAANSTASYGTNPTGYLPTTQYYNSQQMARLTDGIVLATCASWSNSYSTQLGEQPNQYHYGPVIFKGDFTSGRTITVQLLNLNPYEYVTSLVNIGDGAVLCGTSQGSIVQLDSSLNISKSLNIIPSKTPVWDGQYSGGFNVVWYSPTLDTHITSMVYHNGTIVATTSEGHLVFVDWDNLVVQSVRPYFQGGYRADLSNVNTNNAYHIKNGSFLTFGSSGVCLASLSTNNRGSNGAGTSTYVFELDLTSQKVESYLYLPLSINTPTIRSGILNSIGWTFHNLNGLTTLVNYRVNPKPRSNRTHAILEDGSYKAGRKIIIVDDGVSASKIDSDFKVRTTRTYSVPTGKRIIEISLYGSGVTGRKGEVSIYNT